MAYVVTPALHGQAAKDFTRDKFLWLAAVARDRGLPNGAAAVGIEISNLINRESGIAWPSQETLSNRLGLSVRTVRRNLAALIARGHLESQSRGKRKTNAYRLVLKTSTEPDPAKVVGTVRTAEAVVRSDATQMEARSDLQNQESEAREELEKEAEEKGDGETGRRLTQIRHPASPAGAPQPENKLFDRFWAIYPRQVAEADAARAFAEAIAIADAEVIIAGARRYASERHGEDGKYTAYPANWLRAQRWRDPLRRDDNEKLLDEQGSIVSASKRRSGRPQSYLDSIQAGLDLVADWETEK